MGVGRSGSGLEDTDSRGLERIVFPLRCGGGSRGICGAVLRDMPFLVASEASTFFHEMGSFGRGQFSRFCRGGIDIHGHGVAGIRGESGTFGFEAVPCLFHPPGILGEGDCFLRPVLEGFLHVNVEGDGIRDADGNTFGEDLYSLKIINF